MRNDEDRSANPAPITTNNPAADDTGPTAAGTAMRNGGHDVVNPVPHQRVTLPGDPDAARRLHRIAADHRKARISRELDRLCGILPEAGAAQVDYAATWQDRGIREQRAVADLAAVVAERTAALELALADLAAAHRWSA